MKTRNRNPQGNAVYVLAETHRMIQDLAARIQAEQTSPRRCSYAEAVHVAVVEAISRRERRDKRRKREESRT